MTNRIGKNVVVAKHTFGNPGFGFNRGKTKEKDSYIYPLERLPHPFGIVIEDDVEIGACTCIDRGRWRDTTIKRGTKIDNLVQIAHNVVIGKDCLIVAGTVIGGSCEIGNKCFLGMNCCIRQGVKIGDNVTIGAGAVVLKDVPDNMIMIGNPARPLIKKKKKKS